MRTAAPHGKCFVRKRRPASKALCRVQTTSTVLCAVVDPSPIPPCLPKYCSALSVARRRAGQRWSALVSAPTSRVAKSMGPVLGDAQWQDFLAHATARYKQPFLDAFDPPSATLKCVGRAGGGACPHACEVDLASMLAVWKLEHLHVDHEQDVQITCDMWRAARPSVAASWDDGIDGVLLCHLLFDPALRFRCGPSRLGDAGYCHQLHMAHYRGLRQLREN